MTTPRSLLRATPRQGLLAILLGLALGPVAHAVAYAAIDSVRAQTGPDAPPPADVVHGLLTIGLAGQLIGAVIVVIGMLAWRGRAGPAAPTLLALSVLRAGAAGGLWVAALDPRFHLWSVSMALLLPDAVFVALLLRHTAATLGASSRWGAVARALAPTYVLYRIVWASFVYFPIELQASAHLVHRVLSLAMIGLVVLVVARLQRVRA